MARSSGPLVGREGLVGVRARSVNRRYRWPPTREAGIVHLGNFPDGGAGFGAAGLTSWSMTITTGGAQQVGDAAVAGRMLGGGELGAGHG
jgi:hypothetical protein